MNNLAKSLCIKLIILTLIDMASPVAAAIGAGADIAQSIGSAIYGHFESTLAYERQRQMRDEQWAHDAPAAQMQRFKDAGLNPNLIYGQMSNSAAAPAAPETPDSPYVHSIAQSVASGLQADAAVRESEARAELSESQAKYYDSLLPVNESKARNYDANTAWTQRRILSQDIVDELTKQNIEVSKAEVVKMFAQVQDFLSSAALNDAKKNFTDLQSYEQWIKNQYTDEIQKATIQEIRSRTHCNEAQAARYAQIVEQEAAKFGYELAILSNQKDISDAEKAEAVSRKVQALYEQAKYNSIVRVTDTGQPIANGIGGGAYMVADLITGLVGRVFHFTGFQNFTGKEKSSYTFERDLETGFERERSTTHEY